MWENCVVPACMHAWFWVDHQDKRYMVQYMVLYRVKLPVYSTIIYLVLFKECWGDVWCLFFVFVMVGSVLVEQEMDGVASPQG